jgi:ubiquitin
MEKEPSKLISEEILPKDFRVTEEVLKNTSVIWPEDLLRYHKALVAAEIQAKGFRREMDLAHQTSSYWIGEYKNLKEDLMDSHRKRAEENKAYYEGYKKELKEMKELYDKVLEEKKELEQELENKDRIE